MYTLEYLEMEIGNDLLRGNWILLWVLALGFFNRLRTIKCTYNQVAALGRSHVDSHGHCAMGVD